MATCNDCLYHETCHGRIAYCMDIDEATGKEILDIEKRCKDFKNKADYAEVKRGYWIEGYRGLCPREKVIVCNLCGRTTEIKELYCHCGAKMDGAKMSEISTGSKRSGND